MQELKDYLNFKLTIINNSLQNVVIENYDILLVHIDYLKDQAATELLTKHNITKILFYNSKIVNYISYTDKLLLPASINEINQIVENTLVRKNFNKNSSIQIKDYILDKNEKKLIKNKKILLLTEKEIQLLELLLKNNKSLSKKEILREVWKYAPGVDTHTVETHIYRLRKKINSKFLDENFILNNKNGYTF